MLAISNAGAVPSSNGAVSGRLHYPSVVPLFKGSSYCDWSIPQGAQVPGRVESWSWGSCPWQHTRERRWGRTKTKTRSGRDGHELLGSGGSAKQQEGRGRRASASERMWLCGQHTPKLTPLTKSSRQAWLNPSSSPAQTPAQNPVKPTLSIQLGSPFVCSFTTQLSPQHSNVRTAHVWLYVCALLLHPPTATHRQFPSSCLPSIILSLHSHCVPYHSLPDQVERYHTHYTQPVPTQSPERVQSRASEPYRITSRIERQPS